MSNGYDFVCSECDFNLQSGWSHQTASDKCVCINCGIIYSIKGFGSPWGVKDGEICNLYQSIKYKKQRKKYRDRSREIDTGVQVIGVTSNDKVTLSSGTTVTVETFIFELEDIVCLSCHKLGSLKLSLEEGDKCPQCKVGNINNQGEIIY